MALSEQSRHELYLRLEEALGPQAAATLMEHLPPVGWADVATKRDLDHTTGSIRKDMQLMEQGLRKDMQALEQGLRKDMQALEHVLRADMESMEQRLRADLYNALNGAITSQTRSILFGLIGSNLTVLALAFVATSVR